MVEAPQVAPISMITKDAPSLGNMLDDGPVMLLQKSTHFGMLINVDEWNQIALSIQKMRDLEDLIAMQKLEIDRLKSGEPDSVPADIGMLERMAGRA